MSKLKITKKQRWIITELIRGHVVADEKIADLDLDQLLERLKENKAYMDYAPSKASIQFSIRGLIQKGLVSKDKRQLRRGRSRRTLIATPLGFHLCKPSSVPRFGEEEMEDVVVEGFDEL